jgi:ATP-dependent DNA ligase
MPEIAPVGDRDAEVIRDPPEGIAQMRNRFRAGDELSIWGVPLGVTPPFSPMEAKVQAELPRGDAWQYEPKWDGFRAVAFKDGDEVVIHSRNQKPLTRYFPELVPDLQRIKPKRVVLDGEIVIFTGYGTDFDAMTNRIHPAASRVNMLAKEQPATYIAFDLLADGDESLLETPLKDRRKRLEKLLGPKPESIYLSPVTRERDVALGWLKEYRGTGLDGIVAKRVESIYHPGERAMIKVKEQRTADCVVGGFRWGNDGKRVGSLLLGVYSGKTLEYVGHTSGFDDAQRKELVSMLEPLRGGTSFEGGRAPGGPSRWSQDRDLAWEPLRPELVCEVAFDRLENGRFRHGVGFVRWRPDKSPKSCTLAQLKAEASVELKKLFA